MRNKHGKIGATLTALLLATVSTPVLAKKLQSTTAGVAAPGSDGTAPLYRELNPFAGQIDPFAGQIDPFAGQIDPFAGQIDPFAGQIDPFAGQIDPFAGQIDPFAGQIHPFWGKLNPFTGPIGALDGAIYPYAGQINAFWRATGSAWAGIESAWRGAGTYTANPAAYDALRNQLSQLNASSEATWGAAVLSQTGKSFADGFAKPLFAKFGIDLANPASLESLTHAQRANFILDWYDGLMAFSGTDRVDWWMRAAHWTPALTQAQGGGKRTTIGLIDFFVAGDADIKSKTIFYEGVSNFSNGHGAGVASLMVAAHDGRGVMGIAPNASIAAYSPFDATGTADWSDVNRGILKVTAAGASVVNLSLGVPGWTLHPDWKAVFADPAIVAVKGKTVYVIAAGNDGIAQTQNIPWNEKDGGANAKDTSFIVVGSIDPSGKISAFSNQPGEACLTTGDGKCELKLKNRFIVAPGELILVSDDAGGVVRRSGTSFAAPLVSGAIALLHDRWPWLKNFPKETSSIILGTARDLGAPGIDPVYGVGLLDVTASQSPLDFNKLSYYQFNGLTKVSLSASTVKAGGVKASWETLGLYFSAFEKVGATERDFLIPLSSRLVGLTAPNGQRFQDYIYSRMVSWMQTGKFTDLNNQSAIVPNGLGLNLTMTAGSRSPEQLRYSRTGGTIQSSLRLDAPSGRFGLTVGQGDGAIALGGHSGFGLFSDYDSQTGGVNPVLGFASGGAYAAMHVAATPSIGLSIGASERSRGRRLDVLGIDNAADLAAYAGLDAYRANAANIAIDYRVSPAITLQASYTRLAENALLGVRSLDANDLRGGSRSDATTLGGDAALGGGFSLSASATLAKTRSSNDAAALTTAGGLVSSSYQMALTKEHVFGTADRVRFSLAQPLTVERGTIDFKSVQVTDRETGQIGLVSQTVDAAGAGRRFVAEAIYGLSLTGRSELSAFGRGQVGGDLQADDARFTVGGRLQVAF